MFSTNFPSSNNGFIHFVFEHSPLSSLFSMGSYISSTRPKTMSSHSGSMASSSEQSALSSIGFSSQDLESSELESPTPGSAIWEPRKVRAKIGGSYWVVENDRKCVAFCKLQMTVYTFLKVADCRLKMQRCFDGRSKQKSSQKFGQSLPKFSSHLHPPNPKRLLTSFAIIVASFFLIPTATQRRVLLV